VLFNVFGISAQYLPPLFHRTIFIYVFWKDTPAPKKGAGYLAMRIWFGGRFSNASVDVLNQKGGFKTGFKWKENSHL